MGYALEHFLILLLHFGKSPALILKVHCHVTLDDFSFGSQLAQLVNSSQEAQSLVLSFLHLFLQLDALLLLGPHVSPEVFTDDLGQVLPLLRLSLHVPHELQLLYQTLGESGLLLVKTVKFQQRVIQALDEGQLVLL